MPEQTLTQSRLRATMPVVPPGYVYRSRLDEVMTKGTAGPVTLVCAGPGFGKTLMVTSWLAARSGPFAWLAIDETDNDLRAFWTDVLGALDAAGVLSAASPLNEMVPAAAFGPAEARLVRAGLADLPEPTVLVLDDLDRLTDPEVLDSLNALLEHQDANLRLVLIAHSDPPLRLHRIRIRGEFSEIRARELAFTLAESAEMLSLNGLDLTAAQVALLLDRTQGWPAGLRLAAISLSIQDVDRGIERFSGTDRLVAAYLISEILDRQSSQRREFLLRTSVVERVSGPLANAMTGRSDSSRVLESLVAANALVVEIGDAGGWFRYHPLLRELLENRLAVEHPDWHDEVQLETARWFAANGQYILAIRHASAGRAWTFVAQLVAGFGALLAVSPQSPALASALEPASRLTDQQNQLCALLAKTLWHYRHHDYDEMQRDALAAAEYLPSAPEDVRVPAEALLATAHVVRMRVMSSRDLSAASENLLALVDAASPHQLPAARQYRVIALSNLGVGQLMAGELAMAERTLNKARLGADEYDMPLSRVSAESHQSVIDLVRGRLDLAEERALSARSGAERRGWLSEPQAGPLYFTQAMVRLARNELADASDVLDSGLAASGRSLDLGSRLLLGIAAVERQVTGGDRAAARTAARRLREEQAEIDDLPDLLARWCRVAVARVDLMCGEPQAVVAAIAPSAELDFASALERLTLARARLDLGEPAVAYALLEAMTDSDLPFAGIAIEAFVVSALAAQRLHRDSAALRLVGRAVAEAAPQRYLRPFLDLGPQGRGLVSRYRQVVAQYPEFTAALVPYRDDQPTPTANGVVTEHLTERELIVLRYLPTMLKASEIANDLFVSVNTVKSHLRAIYRKFDVTTRRAAVERARTLDLL